MLIFVGLQGRCKVGQDLLKHSGGGVVTKDAAHGIHAIDTGPCFLRDFTAVSLRSIKESIDVGKVFIRLAFEVEVLLIVCTVAIDHNEGGIPK